MNKNFLSLLALVLMLGVTLAACAKKEEPVAAPKEVESLPSTVNDAVDAAAPVKDIDEDIFDLDKLTDEGATQATAVTPEAGANLSDATATSTEEDIAALSAIDDLTQAAPTEPAPAAQ